MLTSISGIGAISAIAIAAADVGMSNGGILHITNGLHAGSALLQSITAHADGIAMCITIIRVAAAIGSMSRIAGYIAAQSDSSGNIHIAIGAKILCADADLSELSAVRILRRNNTAIAARATIHIIAERAAHPATIGTEQNPPAHRKDTRHRLIATKQTHNTMRLRALRESPVNPARHTGANPRAVSQVVRRHRARVAVGTAARGPVRVRHRAAAGAMAARHPSPAVAVGVSRQWQTGRLEMCRPPIKITCAYRNKV